MVHYGTALKFKPKRPLTLAPIKKSSRFIGLAALVLKSEINDALGGRKCLLKHLGDEKYINVSQGIGNQSSFPRPRETKCISFGSCCIIFYIYTFISCVFTMKRPPTRGEMLLRLSKERQMKENHGPGNYYFTQILMVASAFEFLPLSIHQV